MFAHYLIINLLNNYVQTHLVHIMFCIVESSYNRRVPYSYNSTHKQCMNHNDSRVCSNGPIK